MVDPLDIHHLRDSNGCQPGTALWQPQMSINYDIGNTQLFQGTHGTSHARRSAHRQLQEIRTFS